MVNNETNAVNFTLRGGATRDKICLFVCLWVEARGLGEAPRWVEFPGRGQAALRAQGAALPASPHIFLEVLVLHNRCVLLVEYYLLPVAAKAVRAVIPNAPEERTIEWLVASRSCGNLRLWIYQLLR